jgi:hypothetical protein
MEPKDIYKMAFSTKKGTGHIRECCFPKNDKHGIEWFNRY